LLGNFEQAAN